METFLKNNLVAKMECQYHQKSFTNLSDWSLMHNGKYFLAMFIISSSSFWFAFYNKNNLDFVSIWIATNWWLIQVSDAKWRTWLPHLPMAGRRLGTVSPKEKNSLTPANVILLAQRNENLSFRNNCLLS